MLVKCDKCGQGYEVNDAKLSPQGARIKCPACSHIFLIRLNDGKPRVTSEPTPVLGKDGMPASAPQKEESWRIRHIGLTYTFHDMNSLRDWLNARPTLEGVKIAKEEDDWRELGDYPEVLTTEIITKFFPLGDVPTTKSASGTLDSAIDNAHADVSDTPSLQLAIRRAPVSKQSDLSNVIESSSRKSARQRKQEMARTEAKKKEINKTVIVFIICVAVLSAVAIYLLLFMRTGESIIDYQNGSGKAAQTSEQTPQTSQEPVPKAGPAVDQKPKPDVPLDIPSDEEIRAMAEAELASHLEEARAMVRNKRWPEARATLETLRNDRPDHIETLRLLAQTYRGLGLGAKASDIDADIKRLTAEAKEKAREEEKEGADSEGRKADKSIGAEDLNDWSDAVPE